MTVTEFSQADPKKLLIVGDLLIDRTYYVEVNKISPEAPVPVAMLTGPPIDTPGGAGLAAAFSAVHKIPSIFATYTSPAQNTWLREEYNITTIHNDNTHVENAIKTRYIDNERYYHLLRIDNDNLITIPFNNSNNNEKIWFENIQSVLEYQIGSLVILDYRKGLLNEARSQRLIDIAHKASVPVYVDSRATELSKFSGVEILKLNSAELQAAKSKYNAITTHELCNKLNIGHIIETMGKAGASITNNIGDINIYSPDIDKYGGSPDVTGCGDVFDVIFCYHWGIKGLSLYQALVWAVEEATKFVYQPIRTRLR